MYYKVNDFIKDWDLETKSTLKILNTLTDKSLNQEVYEGGRTLGRLAWHLVATISEMGAMTHLNVEQVPEKLPANTSAAAIADLYNKAAESLRKSVIDTIKDENLMEEISMYGQKWTRGMSLEVIIKHQTHHRGQMTVLMRQAGLKVLGVYGPAKEEWAAMGMPVLE